MRDDNKKLREIKLQKFWKRVWEREYNLTVLHGSEFKSEGNLNNHYKPDFIILHKCNLYNDEKFREKPIAVEFKVGMDFKEITTGILFQLREKYFNYRFVAPEHGITEPTETVLAFTTHTLLTRGAFYYPFNFEGKPYLRGEHILAFNYSIFRFVWGIKKKIGNKEYSAGVILFDQNQNLRFDTANHKSWMLNKCKYKYKWRTEAYKKCFHIGREPVWIGRYKGDERCDY